MKKRSCNATTVVWAKSAEKYVKWPRIFLEIVTKENWQKMNHFHSRTHLIGVEVRVRATACKSFCWKLYLDILMSRTVSVVFMFVLFRFVTKDLFSHFAWTSCLSFVACRASKAFSCSYATLMSFWTYQCNCTSWWWCCWCRCSYSFCHFNYDGSCYDISENLTLPRGNVITWLTEAGFIRAGCC